MLSNFLQDLHFGLRMFRKSPGFVAIAIFALALGIGLTTTMFSIVHGALRDLPFPGSDRLLHLERNNPSAGRESIEVTMHDYLDWREQQTAFVGLAAFTDGTVNLSGMEGEPERYDGAFMTANAFDVLGAKALHGRTFRPGEDAPGAPRVVILGYEAWQQQFKGDPKVVGRAIRVNSEPATVIGVMAEGFKFPINQSVWVTKPLDLSKIKRGEGDTMEVFGRLKDGVSEEQAASQMSTIAARLAQQYPETNKGMGAVVKPYVEEFIGDEPKALLFTMLGAVFGVLAVACVNVANLLLARTAIRTREVAIRSSLGASRRRVIVQLLSESFLLCAGGAGVGLALAALGIRLFNDSIVNTNPPYWIDIRLDPTVLLFVLGVTVLTSLLAGVAPAIQAASANLNEVLKDEGRGSSSLRMGRFSRALVIAEIAVSCGLLVGAGLMIKSVVLLGQVDDGFATKDVFTGRVALFESAYPDTAGRVRFFDRLKERVATAPGVRSVALTSRLPGLSAPQDLFAIEGKPYARVEDYPETRNLAVSPELFATLGVELVDGRGFGAEDLVESEPVALVNVPFAERHFGRESPIGRRIRLGGPESTEPWRRIVGVTPDLRMGEGGKNEDPEGIYVPLAQSDPRFVSLVVRTTGAPMAVTPAVRAALKSLDPDLPIYFVRTLDEAIREENWFIRVFGSLFIIFGAAALFLAGVGLYGVMAFSVSRRTQEVGVRMALGAKAGQVLQLVFRQGAGQLAAGLGFGFILALGFSRLLEDFLFGVEPWDPSIFLAISLVLIVAGAFACLVPAQRAARVSPMVAIRS